MRTPKNWGEISIEKYIDLLEVKRGGFISVFDFQLERIAVILNKDAEELEKKIDLIELQELTERTKWLDEKIKPKYSEQIGDFYYKGLKDLRLGEFIDLEKYFAGGYYKNANKILATLYRKKKLDEWGGVEIEPYRFVNVSERSEYFLEIPIENAEPIIREYLIFREEFIAKRKRLFENEDDEEEEGQEFDNLTDEEEDEEAAERSTIEKREAEAQEKALKAWSWEVFIYKLCKGDLTKFEEVTDLKLSLVFNFESMKMDLKIED